MKNFFVEEKFYPDLDSLCHDLSIGIESINHLSENWQLKVELSDLEPIFNVDADNLCQLLADANEDRLSEDFDEEAKVLKALKETIDFEKLKEALPKLYYPNNTFQTITKADIVNFLKKDCSISDWIAEKIKSIHFVSYDANCDNERTVMNNILNQAKEMEIQRIADAEKRGFEKGFLASRTLKEDE
jgi:hypothetical protein